MSIKEDITFIGVGLLVVAGGVWYLRRQTIGAIGETWEEVKVSPWNPFSHNNPLDVWINKTFGLGPYAPSPQDEYQIPHNGGVLPGAGWDD